MEEPNVQQRLRRIALQRLESLQRAGVRQLPKHRGSQPAGPAGSRLDAPHPLRVLTPQEAGKSVAPPIQIAAKDAKAATPVANPPSTNDWDSLRQQVAQCQRCEHLACARTQTVFGIGNPRARLCFFGEAPGAEEDRTGEPFVGRAGLLLTDIIEKGMKLRRSDVYIMNVLKCRPPDNRPPTEDEIENCREFFEKQFQIVKPEFICCLGATATKALFGPKAALGKMRGKWFDYRGARVMITYHPSYLLRNPAAKKDTWQDIQMLMREMGLPVEKN